MLKEIFTAPVSWIYGMVVSLRHKLFDWGILRSEEFDIPIVCVGNLTVGGTGKTPVTEFLIASLARTYNVAVLSRGYKRKTKGFVLATVNSSYMQIGDEPKQIKLKFPDIPVAVCEKRAEGIHRLRQAHPEIDLIILDDAFQHRYVESWVNILLMDYNRPIYTDHMLPLGRLRDSRKQLYRAHFIVVTKCPRHINPLDMRIMSNNLGLYPYQHLYFSRMQEGDVTPLFPEVNSRGVIPGDPVIAMCGIANPAPFMDYLSVRFDIKGKLVLPDHHAYRMSDMKRLEEMLEKASPDTAVIVTEKDAVKLVNRNKIPQRIQERLYYMPINVIFADDSKERFLHQLGLYVRTNQKYSELHP